MTAPNPSRDRRVAVVTGAGQGIGRAVARRLARDGFAVGAIDRDAQGVADTVARIDADGGRASSHVIDLTDRAARDEVLDAVLNRHGRIDVLVNNAADTGPRIPLAELDYPTWDRIFETNVTAAAFLARAAFPAMRDRADGVIINTLSIQRRLPVPTYAAYVASKGALAALTSALAVEFSPHGVRVNAVEPGVIATDTFRGTLADADQATDRSDALVATLLRRSGTPDEVAGVVSFLAGPDAGFLTGAVITVDGGRHLSRLPDPFQAAFGRSRPEGS